MTNYIIAIIAICILVFALVFYKRFINTSTNENDKWERVRKRKKRAIASHISNIQKIHDRTSGAGKKISPFEKKKVKESFEISTKAIREWNYRFGQARHFGLCAC